MMKMQHPSLSKKGLFHNRQVRANLVGQFSGMSHGQMAPEIVTQEHSWISVINPRNQRSLLQACDDCGIVKSENSILKNCTAIPGQAMISSAVVTSIQRVM